MDNSKKRINHFGKYRTPTPNEPGYSEFINSTQNRIENNPKFRKQLDVMYKNAMSIGYTQSLNGVNFLQDQELRYFHGEFNDRTMNHGFGALPGSFNLLESFFKWRKDCFYFELFDEEEHLFSFFDFCDYLTSEHRNEDVATIANNIDDDVIYSFNIINEIKEIVFTSEDSKQYVIGGVSLIKRQSEITLLVCAGELGTDEDFKKYIPNLSMDKSNRPYLTIAPDRKLEPIKLFKQTDILKVNMYLRIDIESRTIDSRMVQVDVGNNFVTYTDDYGLLQISVSDEDELSELRKSMEEVMRNYEPIFQVAYNCLFLPEYFNYYDKEVVPEEHPTSLVDKHLKKKSSKDEPHFNNKYFKKYRDVWVLDRKTTNTFDQEELTETNLVIERNGYWKILEPGKIGVDKNGNEIHGRTWVEKTISWFEKRLNDVDSKINITKGKTTSKSGYIYVMRNASHEIDIFKVGLTTKSTHIRAKQLSKTSSPDQFLIVIKWYVADCYKAEKEIHHTLKDFRLNQKREFFKINLEDLIKIITPIIEKNL